MKLFSYAIIWHPTKEQEKEGVKSKILKDPEWILEKTDKLVGMRAIREIPEEYADQLDQVEIAVAPF